MESQPESLGWKEKQDQRHAILRSLMYVNLQITATTEHISWIEQRILKLDGDSSIDNWNERNAA